MSNAFEKIMDHLQSLNLEYPEENYDGFLFEYTYKGETLHFYGGEYKNRTQAVYIDIATGPDKGHPYGVLSINIPELHPPNGVIVINHDMPLALIAELQKCGFLHLIGYCHYGYIRNAAIMQVLPQEGFDSDDYDTGETDERGIGEGE